MASIQEINDALMDRETVILTRNDQEYRIIRKVLFWDKQWMDAVYFEAVDDPRCAYCAIIDQLEDYDIKDESIHKFTQYVPKVAERYNVSSVTFTAGFSMCMAFALAHFIGFNHIDAGPETSSTFQYVWLNNLGLIFLLIGSFLKVRSEKFSLRMIKSEMKKSFDHDLQEYKEYLVKVRKVRRAFKLSIWEALRFKLAVKKTVYGNEEAEFLKQIESK